MRRKASVASLGRAPESWRHVGDANAADGQRQCNLSAVQREGGHVTLAIEEHEPISGLGETREATVLIENPTEGSILPVGAWGKFIAGGLGATRVATRLRWNYRRITLGIHPGDEWSVCAVF